MFDLPTDSPHAPPRTALIVEDEFLVRFGIEEALAQAGFDITGFASGTEALAWLNGGNKADVLITDIRLGDGPDGWEIAERFHAAHPHSGVIYLSATPSDPGRPTPGSRFFSKPYPAERLVNTALTMVAAC